MLGGRAPAFMKSNSSNCRSEVPLIVWRGGGGREVHVFFDLRGVSRHRHDARVHRFVALASRQSVFAFTKHLQSLDSVWSLTFIKGRHVSVYFFLSFFFDEYREQMLREDGLGLSLAGSVAGFTSWSPAVSHSLLCSL